MARLLVEIKSENMQSTIEVGGNVRARSIVVLPLIFCKIQEKGKPLGNRRDTKRWQSGIDFSQLRFYHWVLPRFQPYFVTRAPLSTTFQCGFWALRQWVERRGVSIVIECQIDCNPPPNLLPAWYSSHGLLRVKVRNLTFRCTRRTFRSRYEHGLGQGP